MLKQTTSTPTPVLPPFTRLTFCRLPDAEYSHTNLSAMTAASPLRLRRTLINVDAPSRGRGGKRRHVGSEAGVDSSPNPNFIGWRLGACP